MINSPYKEKENQIGVVRKPQHYDNIKMWSTSRSRRNSKLTKFEMSSRGEREWLLRVQEREGNWKSPFPKFGNGKGIKKSIPKFREWEGNEKIPFPKFGNGKGMKKIHSQNSGTGREWKNPFPKFGKGNQRPPFLGMTGNGNGNGNNILFTFLDFFFLGLPWKFLPQNLFLTPPHV